VAERRQLACSGSRKVESIILISGNLRIDPLYPSEPTGSTLVGIFNELARNPDHARKIYDEVQNLDVRDTKRLSKLPHLNGVISEGLRLYPALLTGGNRKSSEHGVTIRGRYIPPHTTIAAPRYSISRRRCISLKD